ncbi:MAG: sporulation protein YqfD [Dethiobacteria bacterium]
MLERRGLWPGYLLISLQGPGIARLLNLTVKNGIYFWDLNYQGDTITVKIKPRDFRRLRPLLKKTGCRVKIIQKKGTPFILLEGWRRKGLLVGIVLFCLIQFLLAQFVWQVNIQGNEGADTGMVVAILKDSGVHRGVLKKNIDISGLEKKLLFGLEGLQWVGVSLDGVCLNIQIVEQEVEPPVKTITNLIAAKDGLVTNVLVLAGEAAVDVGETVQKGQVLISGKMTVLEESEEEGAEPLEKSWDVQPKGKVEALVWYEGYAEAPLHKVRKRKTGLSSRSFSLRIKGQEYYLWGSKKSPYRNYELEKIKRVFAWRNLCPPVELLNYNYREYEVDIQPVTPQEALQQAKKEAYQKVDAQLSRGVEVKKRTASEYYFYELGTVGCRAMFETLEDIVTPQFSAGSGGNTVLDG